MFSSWCTAWSPQPAHWHHLSFLKAFFEGFPSSFFLLHSAKKVMKKILPFEKASLPIYMVAAPMTFSLTLLYYMYVLYYSV